MSVPTLSRTGGLPGCLSALLGQWGPVKLSGGAPGNANNGFDDSSANSANGISATNTWVAGRAPRALSDQAIAFLSKFRDQSSSRVAAGSSGLDVAGQVSNAIRAFKTADSAVTAAVAFHLSSLDASLQTAGATTSMMA